MSEGITRLRLDDGTVVWARVSEPQELRAAGAPPPGGGYQDSALGGRTAALASGLADTVRGVVQSLRMGMTAAAPDEVTVEFGLEIAAQSGQLVSLLANAQGNASINVTLTWSERGAADGPGTGGPPPPGPSVPPAPAEPPAPTGPPQPPAPPAPSAP
ncbi:CU044_2847 family protein [Streptomyces sp. TRM 70351]|uniref:CU044_2847 family protein n=1 Tax=Streptomyces sp. TRM 70351 TaxID=3116552 RepID=UPI002E7B5F27|nr:CU044_2847 family protein [Streptomyces sp. TRM 70351]MEE1927623.1 CU044_2847 family protein [Streptomyces sp. TRM 70351]